MKLPLSRIAQFLRSTEPASVAGDPTATGYSIDSRTLQQGELFFAVKGEKMDGHDFVAQAIEKGAIAAVISREKQGQFPAGLPVIAVDDTLVALQTLASCMRRLWGKPLVGVTGSAGKTTTREAIAHVLATRLNVHKSEGNFNNHFGLPLMLLKVQPEHDIAVLEMGMSHAGEITALAKIAQPEVGVVTNVAPVHLEFFDSIAGIARAKYELIASLPATGTAVLNADDEYVSQFGRDFHGQVVLYGFDQRADVRGENLRERGEQGSGFDLVAGEVRQPVELALLVKHNVYNALAAAAVGLQRGMSAREIASALASLQPADKRGQLVQVAGATVINDCYNSNPKALEAMIDALASLPAKRRIVIAGEMLELGDAADELHFMCGAHAAAKRMDMLVGVRGAARKIVEGARSNGLISAEFVETPEDAGDWLAATVRQGDAVLLKASRGVRLERALERWQAQVSASK